MKLDEEAEGTTDDFDLIEMDNQIHEYEKLPKVTKFVEILISNEHKKMKIQNVISLRIMHEDPPLMLAVISLQEE